MKLIIAAAFVAFAAAGAAAQSPSPERWDARIGSISGTVFVLPADGSAAVLAQPGMPLDEGDRVLTSADATADLCLDGGSLIELSGKSDFKLEKTAKDGSIFALTLGSLLAKIQKLGSQSLSVRTETAVAAVRGTEFAVDAADGSSYVGVFSEGRVEVANGAGTEVLTPNRETSVAKGEAPLKASRLKRFAERRTRMLALISRLAKIRTSWTPLAPAARRRARAHALKNRSSDRSQTPKSREEHRTKP